MATSSILKTFEIKTPEAYERFVKIQEEPVIEEQKSQNNRYEEGLEKLKQFSFR